MQININLSLVHPNKEVCNIFEKHFSEFGNVNIIQKKFENLAPHNCFVTAGNSYGIMNAGIDAAVIQFHGTELMDRVQQKIMEEFLGEQPVGTSIIVETRNENYPFIAHTPTMRVPGSIRGTDKVYQAAFASLTAIYRHNISSDRKIKSVIMPALGTGWGNVPYNEAVRQMSVAYKHFNSPTSNLSWEQAAWRQKNICYDGEERVI